MTAVDWQRKTLKTKNELLQLRLTQYEKRQRSTSHRREHSDDHYRDITRRKRERFANSKEQTCLNYNHLVQWIRDCEEYIEYDLRDFSIEIEKIRWFVSKLKFSKKTQWRAHADNLVENSIWKNYIFYLKSRLSNATMRRQTVENNLRRTRQKFEQSISTFDAYLQALYVNLDYETSKHQKKINLRINILEKIKFESLKRDEWLDDESYEQLTKHYVALK